MTPPSVSAGVNGARGGELEGWSRPCAEQKERRMTAGSSQDGLQGGVGELLCKLTTKRGVTIVCG